MERQDKYQQILEAAIELCSENGMENTSIQEIAELAGVAKGTIYLYFKSKDDLMEQVYKYCYEMDIKACSRGVQKQKNTIDKLCRRMDNIIDYLLCHPKEARIEQMYKISFSGRSYFSYYQEEMYQAIEAMVREGIEKKELKDMPASILTRVYYGIAQGLYHGFQEEPELWKQQKIKEQCHEMIRSSMASQQI